MKNVCGICYILARWWVVSRAIVQCRTGLGLRANLGIFLVSSSVLQNGKAIPVRLKTVSIKSTCRG